jgi:PPIC-type PPIASE domain
MLRPALLVVVSWCAFVCTSYGQQPGSTASQPGQDANADASAAVANVPMSAAVITLKGACPEKNGSKASGCVRSLTREQFERLTNALQPSNRGPVSPEMRRQFAVDYAKLLATADAAREMGLENDPTVKAKLIAIDNQILAEALNQHLMEESAHPSDQQYQEYYKQNEDKYREFTIQRIVIPKSPNSPGKAKITVEDQKAYAEKIRERWIAGEDPTKLEAEAVSYVGATTAAPDVNVGTRRPGSLPELHPGVYDLKSGQVSRVFSDADGFYMYKVVSERQIPLNEVKEQIAQTLQRQIFSDRMQAIQAAVTTQLNDAYFGPAIEPPPLVPPAQNSSTSPNPSK